MGCIHVGYAKPKQVKDISQEERLAGLFVRIGIHLSRVEDMGYAFDTTFRFNTYLCSKKGLLISVLSTSEGGSTEGIG